MNPSLALFFLDRLTISLYLYLLPSVALFMLTTLSFDPPPHPTSTTTEALQGPFIRLTRLSEHWRLLNSSKCEASFFSVDLRQANLQLHLYLFHSPSASNLLPLFLRSPSTTFSIFWTCIFAKGQVLLLSLGFTLLQSFSSARFHLSFTRVVNKFERLHQATTRAITDCLSFSLFLFSQKRPSLRYVLFCLMSLCCFIFLCLPTSFLICKISEETG